MKAEQPDPNWTEARLARWNASEGIISGTVMRVEGAGVNTPGDKLQGYLIRPGTQLSLPDDLLAELASLVRSADGFDDTIIKRCRPGTSVGFLLQKDHSITRTDQATAELVLDFGCVRLILGGQGTADIQTSYFDPSRSEFVDFVKRALPDDIEIRNLP